MLFAQNDIPDVLGFVSRFYATLGVRHVDIDVEALESGLELVEKHLDDQPGGVEGASPFKKAAAFLCHFVAAEPIKTPLPKDSALAGGLKAANSTEPDQNVVIALRIAMESLHGAQLTRSDGEECEVSRRLDLSKHSYADIVDALTCATSEHFKYVAVLLEQLTYKTNPRCQYPSHQVANFMSPDCQLQPIISHDDLLDVRAGRARIEVVKNVVHRVDPDDVVDGMADHQRGEPFATRHQGPFHFTRSRRDPAKIDRVSADGAVRTGRVLDGVFVEDPASDARREAAATLASSRGKRCRQDHVPS